MRYDECLQTIKRSKYILKTGENLIGIKLDSTQMFDFKKREGCLKFIAMYTKDSFLKKRNSSSVKKLPFIELDLKIDWLYIFSWIAEIYHNKADGLNKKENKYKQWRYQQIEIDGTYTVEFRIVTSEEDQSMLTIMIDKFKGNKEDKKNFQRMRIPLFEDQVFLLLRNLIAVAGNMPNFYFVIKHHYKKDKALELKRKYLESDLKLKEMKNDIDVMELNISDMTMLYTSAEHRLLFGRWLRFQGESINISSDGFITTITDEFNLESNEEKPGSLWALAFCSAVNMEATFE